MSQWGVRLTASAGVTRSAHTACARVDAKLTLHQRAARQGEATLRLMTCQKSTWHRSLLDGTC